MGRLLYRKKEELRGRNLWANTIANFMVLQGVRAPSDIRPGIPVDGEALNFLWQKPSNDPRTATAIDYWTNPKRAWLAPASRHTYELTPAGVAKIQSRLSTSGMESAVLHERDVILGRIKADCVARQFDLAVLEAIDDEPPEQIQDPIENDALKHEPALDAKPQGLDDETWSQIQQRRGQTAFRAALLAAYGGRCAVTGCDAVGALEAAHIVPYAQESNMDVTNGILLRADIHTLFDLFLLSVDPETGHVYVAPEARSAYGDLHGKPLALPDSFNALPEPARLKRHFAQTIALRGGVEGKGLRS